jgi:hypothetical protein
VGAEDDGEGVASGARWGETVSHESKSALGRAVPFSESGRRGLRFDAERFTDGKTDGGALFHTGRPFLRRERRLHTLRAGLKMHACRLAHVGVHLCPSEFALWYSAGRWRLGLYCGSTLTVHSRRNRLVTITFN